MGCMMAISTLYKLKIAQHLADTFLSAERDGERARAHLQRSINALEGEGGKNFKRTKTIGNPVHGMPGGGIISDLSRPDAVTTFGPSATAAHRLAVRARDVAVRGMKPSATRAQLARSGGAVARLLDAAAHRLLHDPQRAGPPTSTGRRPQRRRSSPR